MFQIQLDKFEEKNYLSFLSSSFAPLTPVIQFDQHGKGLMSNVSSICSGV